MVHIDTGVYGAKRKSFEKVTTRDNVRRLIAGLGIKKHSPENRELALKHFWLEADPDGLIKEMPGGAVIKAHVSGDFTNDWNAIWYLTKKTRQETAAEKAKRAVDAQHMANEAYSNQIDGEKIVHLYEEYRKLDKAALIEKRDRVQASCARTVRILNRIIADMPDKGPVEDRMGCDQFLSYWTI